MPEGGRSEPRDEQQLRFFVEQAPADIAMFDTNMVCLAASRRWVKEYGRGRNDLVGLGHYDVHPDLPATWREVHRRALTGESLSSEEDFWVQADGSEHWLRWAVHPWRDAQEAIGGIIILAEDITERRQVERAAAEWRTRYEAAIGASGQILYDWDPATNAVTWGGNHEAVLQYSLAEMGDELEDWMRRVHPDDAGLVRREIEHVLASGEPFVLEYRVRRRDGSYVLLGDRGNFFLGGASGRRRMIGFLNDVTERRQADRRLAAQHAVTRVLANAPSPEAAAPGVLKELCEALGGAFGAAWEVDRRAKLLRSTATWHPEGSACEALATATQGLTLGPGVGLAGRAWSSGRPLALAGPEDDHSARGALARLAGIHGGLAFPIKRRGEITSVVEILATEPHEMPPELTQMLEAMGSQIGQFIEHRMAQQQLLQSQKMEAVGQLAGGIAHDFNNLLGIILGYADLAARDLGEGHKAQARIAAIRTAAERAASLTAQILTFSRKQPVERQLCDINRIIADTEPMLRRLIGEDVRLAVLLEEGLGAVRADPAQLAQVVMNLAVNARDAMPSGGQIAIETSNVVLDEDYVRTHSDASTGAHSRICVIDTGEGMAPATLAHIFEPFFTTKEPGKGTGLGLAVVFGIVKESGGSLAVHSVPGRGSTFEILLPHAR